MNCEQREQKLIKWIKLKAHKYPDCKIRELCSDMSLYIKDLRNDKMHSVTLKHVIDNIDPYIECYLTKYECEDISDEDYEELKKLLLELSK